MRYKKQVNKDLYFQDSYLSFPRWCSYWHQIQETTNLDISSILEIGPGNNIVSSTLKSMGYDIKTLDIDEKINPDYIDDITNPKKIHKKKFDLIIACQILEHLKYEDALLALKNLSDISQKYIIVSLPIFNRFEINFSFKGLGINFKKAFHFNKPFNAPEHKFNGQHYWAIGKKKYSLNKVREDILKNENLVLKKEFRPFEKSNHYFFILQKNTN